MGIGTTSPSVYHKLDVNGSANFSTDIVVGRNATALSFDMNPAYDSGNYYLNLHKNQSNDGGVLLYSKPTSGSAQLDWQIVNQGTTGDLKFYAAGLAGNALVLDRETGNLQLPEYGAGTLVSDASGNITVSSGGGAGGPYLPLSAGSSYPLTGDLYLGAFNKISGVTGDNLVIGVDISNTSGSSSFDIQMDGATSAFYINNSRNVGIGTDSPIGKLYVGPTWDTSSGGDLLYIKNTGTDNNSYDPQVTNTSDLGITMVRDSATTTGPDTVGLTLYNDDGTAGGFSPMLLFSKLETPTSQFKATMAGIYARSPLGTGNGGSWIDGELIFATAGAASQGIKQRMVINKEGNVGIGTTSPSEKLDVSGNVKITNALLSSQANTDVDTGAEVVAQVSTSTYTAAFFDFVIKKVGNIRSGTVYACHDGTNVEFTETSTNDLGDTSDVTLSVDISGLTMRLISNSNFR